MHDLQNLHEHVCVIYFPPYKWSFRTRASEVIGANEATRRGLQLGRPCPHYTTAPRESTQVQATFHPVQSVGTAGRYSSAGSSSCSACHDTGQYSSAPRSPTCTQCSAGLYSGSGQTSCRSCAAAVCGRDRDMYSADPANSTALYGQYQRPLEL
jgi:hypothetical protein